MWFYDHDTYKRGDPGNKMYVAIDFGDGVRFWALEGENQENSYEFSSANYKHLKNHDFDYRELLFEWKDHMTKKGKINGIFFICK